MRLKLILKGIKNIRNQFRKTFLATVLLSGNLAFANIHEFETTHLKSMAGTGSSGIFMEEAAFLNPASLAFYTLSSLYAQRDSFELKDANGKILEKPKNTAFVIADGNGNLSGSLSYVEQNEESIKRKRWGFSMSSPLSAQSAFGVSVRKTKDENLSTHSEIKYYQTVLGITHSIDPETSLGIVAYDIFNSKGKATQALFGIQHRFVEYITLAFDLGGNYKSSEISKNLLYRGGIQIKILDDFYARFGAFNNKELKETGDGLGLGWVQPKLALEFALKNTTQKANLLLNKEERKIKETSFALSFRF